MDVQAGRSRYVHVEMRHEIRATRHRPYTPPCPTSEGIRCEGIRFKGIFCACHRGQLYTMADRLPLPSTVTTIV